MNVSGRRLTFAVLGANDTTQWVRSAVGDIAGSYASSAGFVGHPGSAPVPELHAYALMAAGLGLMG